MQQNSGNTYNYYVTLLLGLIGFHSAFCFHIQTKKKVSSFDNFEGTGLKHYGYDLFSAIVPYAVLDKNSHLILSSNYSLPTNFLFKHHVPQLQLYFIEVTSETHTEFIADMKSVK